MDMQILRIFGQPLLVDFYAILSLNQFNGRIYLRQQVFEDYKKLL